MATIAAPAANPARAERRFYSRMALFLAALVFIGFAPSFYLRGIVPSPRPNPSLPLSVLLHGALFTSWMLVFVAQTQLVAAGRRALHIKLGSASMALAAAMIPMMYMTSVWQVARANQPPFTTPLDWTALPLAAIVPFAAMIWLGWQRRREPQWHKRMMLGAAMTAALGPAFGRLPLAPPTAWGFAAQMLLTLVFFVPLFLRDKRTLGRTHPATRLAFGLYAVFTVLPVILIVTGGWAPVARHLPGL